MGDKLFKIPQALDYKGDSKNWIKFKQQFDIYMKASGLEKNDSENKVNIFLNIAGDEALEIFYNLNLTSEEKKDYDLVLQGFDNHCMSKENEIYKRFKFFTRTQQPSEFFSEFYDDLLVMASFCNFGNQKERLVRDRIIAGIRNPSLQEKFLTSPDLTLEEVVNICMDQEVEGMDTGILKTEAAVEILEMENSDGESNNNYDELTNVPMNEMEQIHIPNEILFNDLAAAEDYQEDVDLELYSDVEDEPAFEEEHDFEEDHDIEEEHDFPEEYDFVEEPDFEETPDVKPIILNNKNSRCYSKRRKLSSSNELPWDKVTSESKEVSFEECPSLKKVEEEESIGRRKTRMSSKQEKEKDIKTKIAEVKQKLSTVVKMEKIAKRVAPKKKSRSKLKIEMRDDFLDLKEEYFDESEESFLKYYETPVEDQEEYSEIHRLDSETSSVVINERIEPNLLEIENDQNERVEEEVEETTDGISLGMMNEMAEAEYLLEKDTNVSPKQKRKRVGRKKNKNTGNAKPVHKTEIIKVERDNLPPFILKSFRKKTLLLSKMPYPCKKCDATFWTAFQLERHQLVHVLKKVPPPSRPPSKVFKCEECGKEFKKICDLERHTRVHTGEKPSVCNICNKRFQQLYNLNKHLYTHTQEKNFECVICQKKFGRNDVLNRHVLTHSIVKPFKCSLCSRTFIRNTQLKLHLRKHHGLDKDPGSQIIDDPGIESVDDTGNGSLDGNESVDDPVAGTSTEV